MHTNPQLCMCSTLCERERESFELVVCQLEVYNNNVHLCTCLFIYLLFTRCRSHTYQPRDFSGFSKSHRYHSNERFELANLKLGHQFDSISVNFLDRENSLILFVSLFPSQSLLFFVSLSPSLHPCLPLSLPVRRYISCLFLCWFNFKCLVLFFYHSFNNPEFMLDFVWKYLCFVHNIVSIFFYVLHNILFVHAFQDIVTKFWNSVAKLVQKQ